MRNPCIHNWLLLARVGVEIVKVRHPQFNWRIGHRVLTVEVELPIAPLHCLKTIVDPDREPLPVGFFRLAKKEVRLVNAVDRPITWDFRPSDFGKCGKQVDPMDSFVADAPSGHLARPADHERHPDATFQRGEVLSSPRTCPPIPRLDKFTTVVAGENDNRVVTNTELVDGFKHLANIVIHLGKHVGPVPVASLPRESGVW